MSFTSIGWLLGVVAGLVGALMVAPLLLAAALGEPWLPFAVAAFAGALLGAAALTLLRRRKRSLDHRSAFVVVTMSWVVACIIGSLPYILSGSTELSLTDAIFESVSGFTTTGITVLTDLETLPRSLLLWRAMTQWIGGMGVALIGVAILPLLGVGGMSLYKAEAPGPTKDKLVPRISETAKILWVLYVVLTILGTLALKLGGMTLFDAACHTMSAISTGGFSTHDASLGYTELGRLRLTTTVLMVLGGTSFAVLYRTIVHGLPWRESLELRTYVALLGIGTLAVAIDLAMSGIEGFSTPLQALDHASFQVASIMTTTGFTTTDYDRWPPASHAMLFALFFIGGMAGSTAGGVKVVRVVLFVRQALGQFFYLSHPRGVRYVRLDGEPVDTSILQSVSAFVAMWISLILIGMVFFSICGFEMLSAFSASATTLGNVGPGFESIGPSHTWADVTSPAKVIGATWMILGRLEVYTVLVLFTPGFWRA